MGVVPTSGKSCRGILSLRSRSAPQRPPPALSKHFPIQSNSKAPVGRCQQLAAPPALRGITHSFIPASQSQPGSARTGGTPEHPRPEPSASLLPPPVIRTSTERLFTLFTEPQSPSALSLLPWARCPQEPTAPAELCQHLPPGSCDPFVQLRALCSCSSRGNPPSESS